MPATGDGADWLDEAATGKYHWTRVGSTGLDAELAPSLPYRVRLGFREGRPVLYLAIGINGSPDYWQWASINRETREPMPKEQALAAMREVMELASVTAKSKIKSGLPAP